MKTLLPNQKSPIKTLSDKPFNISEEMWNHLIQDISSLQVRVENDEISLEDYKNAIAEAFTTVALTANTANINEANIANLIATVLESEDFRGGHIHSADISTLTAMVSDNLQAGSIETGSIKVNTGANIETLTVNDNARVDGNLEVGGTINVDHVTINDFTVDNLAVSQAEINNENVVNSHIDTADIDAATIDNAQITDVEITRAVIADIDNNHLDTEFITHKTNYLTQIDADNFYIKLPYFQNGAYYIYITKADGTFVGCIEDFNSSNNHFFRWSFVEPNTLNNIYLNGYNTERSQSAYYLNTRGERYNIYYQCTSYDTVEPPATSDALGFTPDKRFNVTEVNGNWFTMPVALYNEGEGGGVLTLTASDVLLYADDNKSYNGTSNVHNTVYKPNQSLNKTDDVTFNSVEAPFLDVAELSIVNKAKLPNVYNGPALSQAEQAELMDDTLYIPQSGNTTGVTVPGVEFVDRETDEPLNYWASSVQKAIDQDTFRTDEYKPTDGYILSDDVTVSDTVGRVTLKDSADVTNRTHLLLVQHIATGKELLLSLSEYNEYPAVYLVEATDPEYADLTPDGHISFSSARSKFIDTYFVLPVPPLPEGDESALVFFTNSSLSTIYDITQAQPGDEFYLFSGFYPATTEDGDYRVRYVDTVLKATAGINYLKEGAGTAARINRKTTRSSGPAIDEIVPINNALFDSATQEQQVGQVVTDEYEENLGAYGFIDDTCINGPAPADYDRTEITDTRTLVTIDGETPVTYYTDITNEWRYVEIDDETGQVLVGGLVEDPSTLAILNGETGTVVDAAGVIKHDINYANATLFDGHYYSKKRDASSSNMMRSLLEDLTAATDFQSYNLASPNNANKNYVAGYRQPLTTEEEATAKWYLWQRATNPNFGYIVRLSSTDHKKGYQIVDVTSTSYNIAEFDYGATEYGGDVSFDELPSGTALSNANGTLTEINPDFGDIVHSGGAAGSTTDHTYEYIQYEKDVTTQTGTVPADYDRTETSTVTESGHTITTVTYYKDVVIGGYQPGNPLAYDPVTRTLIPANNAPAIVLGDNYRFEVVEQPSGSLHTHLLMRRETVDTDTYKYNELATFNSEETFDGTTPLVYDAEDNSLKPAEDITINGKAHISGNVNIDGDLTVDGKITAVSEEVVQSKADYITLRENNPNGLANGEHSGIIINNIDGEGKNTALVVDNDGMLRVGSAVGTETTYNEIYYGKNDNKWYSDATLETEVVVDGILSRWGTSTETDDYIEYTDAVFTVIDASHNEPLLTRAESDDLTDGAPLYWNEERKRAENTAATSGQQVWMSKMTPGHLLYDKNVVIGDGNGYGYLVSDDSGTRDDVAFDSNMNQLTGSFTVINGADILSPAEVEEAMPERYEYIYFNVSDNKVYVKAVDRWDPSHIIWCVETGVTYDASIAAVVMSSEETTAPDPADLYEAELKTISYNTVGTTKYLDPSDMSETTYPSDIPNDAVITDSTTVDVLYCEDDDAFFDVTNQYKITAVDSEGNLTTDDTVTPTGTVVNAQLIYRNIHADATEDKMSYGWQQSSQGSFFVFDTFAEYQAALTIPSGQPGHIPTPEEGASLVVVRDRNSYLIGEIQDE